MMQFSILAKKGVSQMEKIYLWVINHNFIYFY